MNSTEIVGSTNLIILLEDVTFVDFFNTFLSLPVFGQMPFYTVELAQWSLWPEIPPNLIAKYKGLLIWLEKYRLPLFCKTDLCFHYLLCQELISFIKSPEGASMMKWKKADQWLLQKCISSVRNMWRFSTYLKGSAGEELFDFWILAEKILSIDEMDVEMKDHYLSLLLVLKATHLQEGSRVVTLCNMNIKSLLNLSIWHPNQSTTRREILSHMQKVALFKLQSYWLPNFYMHAKMVLAREEQCQGLMQEYDTRTCSICYTHDAEVPLNMSIKTSTHPQRQYSSQKMKRKMWQMIKEDSWSILMPWQPCALKKEEEEEEEEKEEEEEGRYALSLPPAKVPLTKQKMFSFLDRDQLCTGRAANRKDTKPSLQMEGLFEKNFHLHLRTITPIIYQTSHLTARKAPKHKFSLESIRWALSADIYAGGPFHTHLKKRDLKVEIKLLELWQDLNHFLSVLMHNRNTGNAVFLHVLGNRICELYLNEQTSPPLPLKQRTLRGLREMLPSGDVNLWVPKAQEEICKLLSQWYAEFLKEEDISFLNFTTQTKSITTEFQKKESISKEKNVLLYKRLQESLELSQGLATMKAMDSLQWEKVALENLEQGGSLQVELKPPVFLEDVERMSFEELSSKYPKKAIEKISDDFKIYSEKSPTIDFKVEIIREPKILSSTQQRKTSVFKKNILRKPSIKPRNFVEVLLNASHLEYFKEFLRERKSETPLLFLIAMHKMITETNEKMYNTLTEHIFKTFFHSKIPPQELLQCDTPFIRELGGLRRISTTALILVQGQVTKSLEEKWFKEYQALFQPRNTEVEQGTKTPLKKSSKLAVTYLLENWHSGCSKMLALIRSFCKYRRFMSDPKKRQEYEDFLRLELYNTKENFSPSTSSRTPANHQNPRNSGSENGDLVLVKRRILGNRIIIVNFAMNDNYFFSEIGKFNDLVSSAQVLQINRTYNFNDLILMKAKINIMLRLYLCSDLPPKLRVNISESLKDSIVAAIAEGHLNRTIFFGAIMSLFPVIMYFWKRYCTWKVLRAYGTHQEKFKEKRSPSKPISKVLPLIPVEQPMLKFTLLRGIEWFYPQQNVSQIPSKTKGTCCPELTPSGPNSAFASYLGECGEVMPESCSFHSPVPNLPWSSCACLDQW
ncbi:regulator of G-protein signaling protein-like [Suncus etruscus]|uniref:regulator of G-protein signaling protein-like n=1 Tax=Suncus etruscus TaxID=109475 RepID=UPI002110021A|nr:regulator of G-protein signaling protein-like [Suncus etruscus]